MTDKPTESAQHIDEEEKEIEQKMVKIVSLMPKEVQNRFKALKTLSDRRSKMNDEFELELKKLENIINEKKKPIYEQRKLIITGELKDFTSFVPKFDETYKTLETECAELAKKPAEEKEKEKEPEHQPTDVSYLKGKDGVPDFWFKAMKNSQMVWEVVKEKDEEILKHLRHIESEKTLEPKTLTVRFYFNDNEYFENKEISMKIIYKGDEDEVQRIEGTQINWKEGKDPTKKKIKKKQKHKKTNETRTIVKTVEADSFFNVFNNRVAPEDGVLDEEEEQEVMDKIDEAMNLAEDIDDVLIPDALEYFLGLNEDFFDPDMVDEDEEDEESDEEEEKPKKKGGDDDKDKGGKKKGGKKDADKKEGEQQQECKQQ